MSWLTLDEVLNRVGQKKLAALTLEPGDKLLIGTGDATEDTFNLPFAAAGGLLVYADTVLVAGTDYTVGARLGTGTRDRIIFDTAPALGVRLEASATSGIAVEAVFAAMDQGQDYVTAKIRAAGLVPPTVNATDAPVMLKSWTLDIGSYLLVSQARRAPVSGAYPELKERHDLARKDLDSVVDGKMDLGAWLEEIDVEAEDTASFGKFVGEAQVFGGGNGLT
jgi:hypothetical protein